MKELKIMGNQKFMGMDIPVIEGGFGEGQKVILVKTVAEIHGIENPNDLNKLINNNIDEFEFGVDIINLKDTEYFKTITNRLEIKISNNTKYFYLLSEQGYMLLVMLMRTEKAKEIRKKLTREYFSMREVIKKSKEDELVLNIYHSTGIDAVNYAKELSELKVSEATKPLLEEKKRNEPLVTFANRVIKDGDNILVRDLAKIATDEGFKIGEKRLYNKLREWKYICQGSTKPTQYALEREYFVVETRVINTPYGSKQVMTSKVTPKAQVHIIERLMKELDNE